MDDFIRLARVLKQCKMQQSLTLHSGSPGLFELKNKKAKEILKGLKNQQESKDLKNVIEIEYLFIKVREIYLNSKKLKKSLLNRITYLTNSQFTSEEFIKYIELRVKAFISCGDTEKELECIEKMNEIVGKIDRKSVRNILMIKTRPAEGISYEFKGIPINFKNKEVKELFCNEDFKGVIRALKHSDDFDSKIITAISKVEKFKKGVLLEAAKKKKCNRTLEKYMSQWNSLYKNSVDLFSANYIDEEYLHKINKEIRVIPLDGSIPFDPVVYDISSIYISIREEAQSKSTLSGILSRMTLFRRQ